MRFVQLNPIHKYFNLKSFIRHTLYNNVLSHWDIKNKFLKVSTLMRLIPYVGIDRYYPK